MVLEVKIILTFGSEQQGLEEDMKELRGSGRILFLDLGSGDMNLFTLQTFADLYPYDLFVIYIMFHLKKL